MAAHRCSVSPIGQISEPLREGDYSHQGDGGFVLRRASWGGRSVWTVAVTDARYCERSSCPRHFPPSRSARLPTSAGSRGTGSSLPPPSLLPLPPCRGRLIPPSPPAMSCPSPPSGA